MKCETCKYWIKQTRKLYMNGNGAKCINVLKLIRTCGPPITNSEFGCILHAPIIEDKKI